MKVHASLSASAFVAPLLVAGAVHAGGSSNYQSVSHPTNYCQSALPVFDGNIRKRPQAVQNEGTASAFVTCSYPSAEGRTSGSSTTRVWQYFINSAAVPVTINCTGVAGHPGDEPDQYVPKTIDLDPGEIEATIIWEAEDFDGAPEVFPEQGNFSISCNLPPGAGLAQAYVNSIVGPPLIGP